MTTHAVKGNGLPPWETFILCLLFVGIFALGMRQGGKNREDIYFPRTKVLNDWYMLKDGSMKIYRKGFFYLETWERDSIYQDAIQKLR